MFTGWSLGRNVTRATMFAPHSDSTRKRVKWQHYRGKYSITKTATNKSTYFHNPQNFQLELIQNSFVLLNGCTSVCKRNLSFLAIFHFRVKDRKMMCKFFPCCSIQDQGWFTSTKETQVPTGMILRNSFQTLAVGYTIILIALKNCIHETKRSQ